jgi:hypothetical protein
MRHLKAGFGFPLFSICFRDFTATSLQLKPRQAARKISSTFISMLCRDAEPLKLYKVVAGSPLRAKCQSRLTTKIHSHDSAEHEDRVLALADRM